MQPELPYKSYAIFWRARYVTRGDIVLVNHPDAGLIAREVAAVSRTGRVAIKRRVRSAAGTQKLPNVEPRWVEGRLLMVMRWGRFLPTFHKMPQPASDEQ